MRTRLLALVALLTLVLLPATSAACGGSHIADVGAYLGDWQRVSGGEPDPSFTLRVERRDGGVVVTVADATTGQTAAAPATVEGGYLACSLPMSDSSGATAAPTSVQLSLDQDGQLVIDQVLADGTTEPVWIYARPAATSASPEP